jgi:hypothetical protein
MSTTNVGLHGPAASPFIWCCVKGAHCTNGRRPRSGREIEIGFPILGNRGVILSNHEDHIPNTACHGVDWQLCHGAAARELFPCLLCPQP